MPVTATYDRRARSALVEVRGDVTIGSARELYDRLRAVARRRDITSVVVDFAAAKRLDSAALAAISLGTRAMPRKQVRLAHLGDRHRAALELVPPGRVAEPPVERVGAIERVGTVVLDLVDNVAAFRDLVVDVLRQLGRVILRRKRLPKGELAAQISTMAVGGVPITSLLALLLGLTLGFQGVVLLHRFGAGLFVADLIGISMVRELGPMMTAIIVTGRTGAALAAELGTMRVRGEIDALQTMGVSPARFLLLPRMIAITVALPALSLIAMFVGIVGGMIVATAFMDLPVAVFWARLVERVELTDFIHGIVKTVVFAWIIGFVGCHMGMRASADASSVGSATTRAVVVGVFLIILVDAIAATLSLVIGGS